MRRRADTTVIVDAEGTEYRPSTMWRITLMLVVESVGLVVILYGIALAWQALN